MLQQEAEHLAHAKYRADSERGLDGRRVAVPDLAHERKSRLRRCALTARALCSARSASFAGCSERRELPAKQGARETPASARLRVFRERGMETRSWRVARALSAWSLSPAFVSARAWG
jgi:hypothetical protein